MSAKRRKARLLRHPAVPQTLGRLLAAYLRAAHRTNRLVCEPADYTERYRPLAPAIVAMWHGQHFMIPFTRPGDVPAAVMISQSADAEINAVAAERLGLTTIRASGAHKGRDIARKRGHAGFVEALRALEAGTTVALTADVPKIARVAGRGIVLLAKHSGRPIVPLAYATSRNIDVKSWDRASVSLPFGRSAIVMGDPILVPPDGDDAAIEAARLAVESSLNRVVDRAYELTGVVSKFRHGQGHG